MPDDCYELEKKFFKRLDEHYRKMATDEKYRKQWQAQQQRHLNNGTTIAAVIAAAL
jgi:hypothetical protein